MSDDVLKLIKLFSENKLSEIENDIAPLIIKYFNRDWTITKDDFYIKNYDLIKHYKENLEAINSNPQVLSEKDQVKKCLDLCWRESNFSTSDFDTLNYKMEVFSRLVANSYENRWSANQMKHFQEVSQIFRDYNNYFISYTNHFARIVNDNFDFVYKKILVADEYSDDILSKRNLLASACNRYFNMNNLRRGFFDRDSMRISDIISERVKQNVEKSIALVQLLSKASFEYTEPNWSYTEFKEYYNSRQNFKEGDDYRSGFMPLPFFVLIEKNPLPKETDLIPDEYANWINLIKNQLHSDLSGSTDYDQFKEEVDKLIADIINFKSKMICCVPD